MELSINKLDEIKYAMKNYLCTILSLSVLFLVSCNNPENGGDRNKEISRKNILQNDSLTAVNKAVDAFSKSILSCKDSISKYNIASINDTCIKFIYVIYGAKRLEKYDSLTVAECSIKLTGFRNIADSMYSLHYTLFIKDTIPIIADLFEDAIIHTFEYNRIQKIISKAYLGQETTYIIANELKKAYFFSLNKKENQRYFAVNFAKLHPDFVRLVLPNLKIGK